MQSKRCMMSLPSSPRMTWLIPFGFFETCSHLIGRVKKKKKNTFTFLHQITYYVSKVRILKWKNNRTSRKTCAQSGLKCGCQLIDTVHRWCQCALMCPYVHIWKREREKKTSVVRRCMQTCAYNTVCCGRGCNWCFANFITGSPLYMLHCCNRYSHNRCWSVGLIWVYSKPVCTQVISNYHTVKHEEVSWLAGSSLSLSPAFMQSHGKSN